mmetsp:Transcript_46563/g.76010  ORF Transcript_46563/g.76010 Transcript_46563/m.76010 type:complete len:386 (-) Transcript_46563:13-1170(-)
MYCIIQKHKAECRRIEEQSKEEKRRDLEDLQARYENQMQQIRERVREEKDREIERERETFRLRMREQTDRYEQQMSSQRMRVQTDVQQELHMLEGVRRQDKVRHDEVLQRMDKDCADRVAAAKAENAKAMEDLTRRHHMELSSLKEQLRIEKDQWQKDVTHKLTNDFKEREKGIRMEAERQRDAEIETVIRKLEEEASAAHEHLIRDTERRASLLADRHNAEVRQISESERNWRDKYSTSVNAQTAAEKETNALRGQLTKAEGELERAKGKIARLEEDIDEISRQKEALRADVHQKTEATGQELQALREQLREAEAAYKASIAQVHSQKSAEVEGLHERIRQTVSRKDESIAHLREQLQGANTRVDQLRQELEEQRQELFAISNA